MKLLNKPTYNNIKTISHPYMKLGTTRADVAYAHAVELGRCIAATAVSPAATMPRGRRVVNTTVAELPVTRVVEVGKGAEQDLVPRTG